LENPDPQHLQRSRAPALLETPYGAVEPGVRTLEAVLESEARLRGILNQAAMGIALAGLDGHFVDMNRKFTEILGYTADELRALTFLAITHPDDVAETSRLVKQLLAGEIPEYVVEKRYIRKDGTHMWSRTTVTLMREPAGQPERFVGVVEDITLRKRAEAALVEETRILELLNETGRLLASEVDLHPLLQAVTDAATELSGAELGAFFYSTTDDNGDAFRLYTLSGAPPESFEGLGQPRATALFGPTFRGEPPIRIDDVGKDPRYGRLHPHLGLPEGHPPVRSYLAVPVKSRSGEVIGGLFFGHSQPGVFTERAERLIAGVAAQAGTAIDNARLYEARKTLLDSERAARTVAEQANRLKDEFLMTLSHELRTPLNAILGWAQVLQVESKTESDYQKGLQVIERNARVQRQLVEDLLDMSRITAGKMRLEMQIIEPAAFVAAAVETVKPAADAKVIRLETTLDRTAGPISGDPDRLQQIVWNLLTNAIKFTSRDGEVRVTLAGMRDHVEITIADNGMGIRPDFLPRVFERFSQGDLSMGRRFGGVGLGLPIVKSLVEAHGGTVSVTSPGVDQGTAVTIQLPRPPRLSESPCGTSIDQTRPGP
jgi:PAS domain S-box-containing protein